MLSVESRLAHMDELGIETRALYPTLFSGRWSSKPSVELRAVQVP